MDMEIAYKIEQVKLENQQLMEEIKLLQESKIAVLNVKEGDTIALIPKRPISEECYTHLLRSIKKILCMDDIELIVLPPESKIHIIRKDL